MPTRRDVLYGLLVPAVSGLVPGLALRPAFAQMMTLTGDTIATSAGNLIIHPVNHASMVLGFGDQVIYIDPVGGAARYAGLPKPTTILITHAHPDHFDVPTLEALGAETIGLTGPKVVVDALPATIKAKAVEVANGETGMVGAVPMAAIAAYNTTPSRLDNHPKGVGNGYVLTFGDKKVYIAGDTEETPEMDALTGIDVAFLPMNLPYTMSVEQAATAVKAFKPKIVYPYHYKGSDTKEFAALVGNAAEVRLVDWYKS